MVSRGKRKWIANATIRAQGRLGGRRTRHPIQVDRLRYPRRIGSHSRAVHSFLQQMNDLAEEARDADRAVRLVSEDPRDRRILRTNRSLRDTRW